MSPNCLIFSLSNQAAAAPSGIVPLNTLLVAQQALQSDTLCAARSAGWMAAHSSGEKKGTAWLIWQGAAPLRSTPMLLHSIPLRQ